MHVPYAPGHRARATRPPCRQPAPPRGHRGGRRVAARPSVHGACGFPADAPRNPAMAPRRRAARTASSGWHPRPPAARPHDNHCDRTLPARHSAPDRDRSWGDRRGNIPGRHSAPYSAGSRAPGRSCRWPAARGCWESRRRHWPCAWCRPGQPPCPPASPAHPLPQLLPPRYSPPPRCRLPAHPPHCRRWFPDRRCRWPSPPAHPVRQPRPVSPLRAGNPGAPHVLCRCLSSRVSCLLLRGAPRVAHPVLLTGRRGAAYYRY